MGIRTLATDRTYPVFAFGAPLKGRPLYEVDRERRDEMLAAEKALSVSGGKALQLVKKFHSRHGLSASPDHRLMQRYVEARNSGQDQVAIRAIDMAWGPKGCNRAM
jgi:hypothetical protein